MKCFQRIQYPYVIEAVAFISVALQNMKTLGCGWGVDCKGEFVELLLQQRNSYMNDIQANSQELADMFMSLLKGWQR